MRRVLRGARDRARRARRPEIRAERRARGAECRAIKAVVSGLLERCAGVVAAGSRADLARPGIGVAVTDGAPAPEMSTRAALERPLRHARSLDYRR